MLIVTDNPDDLYKPGFSNFHKVDDGRDGITIISTKDACLRYISIIINTMPDKIAKMLSKNSYLAYLYATEVRKRRWHAGELVIAKDPELAYYYARDMVKKRWERCEIYIIKDIYWAYMYTRDILQKRWPKFENKILHMKNPDPDITFLYAAEIMGKKWKKAEHIIFKKHKKRYMEIMN